MIPKILAAIVLSSAVPFLVSAQEAASPKPATVVANINLSNVTIIEQNPKEIHIGFDIVNNGDTTQSDIRYGVELIKKSSTGQSIADTFTAAEFVTVKAKATLHREFVYPTPSTLSGTYELWVISRTTSGMMLGLGSPGSVVLTGTVEHIAIAPESCYATVGTESKQYSLLQGVDVKSEEMLVLTCVAQNNFSRPISTMPTFETYERSTYGNAVPMNYPAQEDITFNPNETKAISFTIPKPEKAQAYDVTVFLMEKGRDIPVSGSITMHYVVAGASATIQNASLDKTAYKKGETITATLRWSPSADRFPSARLSKSGTPVSPTVQLSIVSEKGVACVAPVTRKTSSEETLITVTSRSLIDCPNPVTAITLTDDNGKVFDARTFGKTLDNVPVSLPAKTKSSPTLFIIGGIIALAALVSAAVAWKRRGRPFRGMMKSVLFAVVVSSGFSMGVGKVEAVSFEVIWGYEHFVYTVNANKSVYAAGETIILSESAMSALTCGNYYGLSGYQITTSLLSSTNVTTGSVLASTNIPVYTMSTFVAPPTPGEYSIEITGCSTSSGECGTAAIPLTVTAVNNPPAAPLITPSVSNTYLTGSSQSFALQSADPDGDQIRYGVDWDNDGSVDQWVPGSGYVASGTSQSATRIWATPGPYTFKVLAEDTTTGNVSSWTSHGLTVLSAPILPPPPSAVLSLCTQGGIPIASTAGPHSRSLVSGASERLLAYSDTTPGICGDSAPITDALWMDTPSPAITIAGATASPQTITAVSGGSDTVVVTKGPSVITLSYTVNTVCTPTATCVGESGEYCQGQPFTIPNNGCGNPLSCTGTRYCDFNWKEVSPGS